MRGPLTCAALGSVVMGYDVIYACRMKTASTTVQTCCG